MRCLTRTVVELQQEQEQDDSKKTSKVDSIDETENQGESLVAVMKSQQRTLSDFIDQLSVTGKRLEVVVENIASVAKAMVVRQDEQAESLVSKRLQPSLFFVLPWIVGDASEPARVAPRREGPDVTLSRNMSAILRHQADQDGLRMRHDGSVILREMLNITMETAIAEDVPLLHDHEVPGKKRRALMPRHRSRSTIRRTVPLRTATRTCPRPAPTAHP